MTSGNCFWLSSVSLLTGSHPFLKALQPFLAQDVWAHLVFFFVPVQESALSLKSSGSLWNGVFRSQDLGACVRTAAGVCTLAGAQVRPGGVCACVGEYTQVWVYVSMYIYIPAHIYTCLYFLSTSVLPNRNM